MWLIAPLAIGFVAACAMYGMSFGMAMGASMGSGASHATDLVLMNFITVPAALLSAIVSRRGGLVRALVGSIIFSLPVVWFCYQLVLDCQRHNLRAELIQWYRIGGFAVLTAVSSSALFALITRNVSKKIEVNEAT